MNRELSVLLIAWIALVSALCATASADDIPGIKAPAANGDAATQNVDKSVYNLFNPTPRSQMRSFNPDRPSVTTGPLTLDAGHVQVEMSFAEYTRDHRTLLEGISVAPMNIRVGILNNAELDVAISPYQYSRTGTADQSQYVGGFGDARIQSKINLWGNEGGNTALGIIPFLNVPTAATNIGTGRLQGGLALPFATNLPGEFSFGTTVQFGIDRNSDNTAYGVDILHTATVSHAIVGTLAAYVEYAGIAPSGTGRTYQAFFDSGLTYAISENIQLDLAVNLGLSRSTSDYTVLSGITFRL
ncbi:MAG: transporter [Planctomycetota bacterium]|nr:transporter [Planctomycetota bacterium]